MQATLYAARRLDGSDYACSGQCGRYDRFLSQAVAPNNRGHDTVCERLIDDGHAQY